MPYRDTPWPTGTPCWVEILGTDAAASKSFYAALFGWQADEGSPEFGYYVSATLEGKRAAGVGAAMPGDSQEVAWTTYLATDDLTATITRITGAGGSVSAEPMEIPGLGSYVIAADPTGAPFGVWQAGSHTGAEVYNQHGAQIWNERMTRDVEGDLAFYTSVFGYSSEQIGDGESLVYHVLSTGGRVVGGIGRIGEDATTPSAWLSYFAVDDTDAAVARAVELGSTVVDAPQDTPYGRLAAVTGPDGERICLMCPPADQVQG